jgi:hypothetical protein
MEARVSFVSPQRTAGAVGHGVGADVGELVGAEVGAGVGAEVGVGADVGELVVGASGGDVGGTTMTAITFETVNALPVIGSPSIALTFETMVADKSDESDAIAAWTAATVEVGLDGVIFASTFTDPALSSTETSLFVTPGVDFTMTSTTFVFKSLLTASDKRL